MSVGVIGWWASWPAEEVKGYVVNDHANPVYSDFLLEDGRYLTADPDRLRALRRDVFPADAPQRDVRGDAGFESARAEPG